MKSIDQLIQRCDESIKAGRPQEVSKLLSGMNFARLPREARLPLAKICRRAGHSTFGLKVLARIVLGDGRQGDIPATPAELAEYAVLLQRSGALNEAIDKLSRVDTRAVPEALLYRAFMHFARWEFDRAIPHLRAYLQTGLTPNSMTVGRVNLAFALIETRQYDEALAVLDETESPDNLQLLSNMHALRAQIHLQKGDFSRARAELEVARDLVSATQTNDQLFGMKWKLILDGLESRSAAPFNELRDLAMKNRAWEIWREADLYSLKVDMNRERFVHLYFGSPLEGFREHVRMELNDAPTQPVYVLGKKSSPRFDLRTGTIDDKAVLNPGRKCHQMIDVLLQDFYRPIRVAGLFSSLFPSEQFNIHSSPHRVHQLISRARQTYQESGIPVDIREHEGFYSLHILGPISFRVPLKREPVSITGIQLEKLKSAFASASSFSAKEVRDSLKISAASAHRLIHKAIRDGQIERAGQDNFSHIYRVSQKNAA